MGDQNEKNQTRPGTFSMGRLIELRSHEVETSTDCLSAYDQLHEEGYLQQKDSFYKWLLSLFPLCPGKQILDISCGRGRLLHFAQEARLKTTGIDLSPAAVKAASQVAPSSNLTVANAENLPFKKGLFNYLTNIGSLEHYFNPARAIKEMSRVLAPTGLALVLLPNTFGLLGNIFHVWRTGDVFDDGQPLQRYGTPVQWSTLLQENGLRVIRVIKYEREFPRTWRDGCWYLLHPHKLVRVFLSFLVPQNMASFLVYLCRKAE
ncbi:MAG TPA: class I SAM-dependent methyltransferase [Thermodesulfobacteriota bacterium]|nr:class I SAM-dependent methyltransferase [Thermodesulfobacteriota bacterium]